MKKKYLSSYAKTVRYIITYLACLLLAVLIWLAVMYDRKLDSLPTDASTDGTESAWVTDSPNADAF
jgi:hypothetical protein